MFKNNHSHYLLSLAQGQIDVKSLIQKKMLGSFNPILGQIWTANGLNDIFNPMFVFVHI